MTVHQNIEPANSVRELARELCLAQDAFRNAYRATLQTGQTIEQRIDNQLAVDAAEKTLGAARIALTRAQMESA